MHAVLGGFCECVNMLATFEGADVNMRDDRGNTTLVLTVKKGDHTSSCLLIRAGARCERQTSYRPILLLTAAECNSRNNNRNNSNNNNKNSNQTRCMELLFRSGAYITPMGSTTGMNSPNMLPDAPNDIGP